MNCSNNHLRICKFIEEDGELRKPNAEDIFHVVVESCSQRRYYILNKSNCFCVELDHLCNETYCVYEEDYPEECEVQYMVDGKECREACVNFNRQDFHHVKIVNHMGGKTGTLCIRKRVFDACGKEVRSDDSFPITVRGREFEFKDTLSCHNRFKVCIDDLPFGSYEVKEKRNRDYDVTYLVNGVEKERGIISVGDCMNEVEIHNRMVNGTHVLRICKWMLIDGKLVKPNYDQSFDITIRDQYAYKEYTLDCENHFCMCLEGDRHDTYRLQELDSDYVIYEVDGVEVDRVEVTMDSDHDVRIINVDRPGPCPGDTALVVRKWIEEDGNLRQPYPCESFMFGLQGCYNEDFVLNADNDFMMRFDNLKSGYYCLHEMEQNDYTVLYEVNGELQDDGYMFLEEGITTMVNIINRVNSPTPTNMLRIVKRVHAPCQCDGDNTMPNEGCFTVYVKQGDNEQYYDLNRNNGYEVNVPITGRQCVVYEVNPTAKVTYRLDGVEYENEVSFRPHNRSHEIMVINHIGKVNFVI